MEFIIGGCRIAEGEYAQILAEDLVYAESHPFSEESTCISGVFFVFEADFDFFMEIDGLELSVAGHEQVGSIYFEKF